MKHSNKPLLSVIVPVYNGIKFLEETVGYIVGSDYDNIEILLIDDGSSDDSLLVIEQLAKKESRIRCFYQENQGIAATRNLGLKMARGEYICLCDQDDVVEREMYSTLLNKMVCECADIGICGTGRYCGGKKSQYEVISNGIYAEKEILDYILYPILFQGYNYSFVRGSNYLYGNVWKCIFKTKFIRDNGLEFKSFIRYEDDWLFVTKALSQAEKVVTDSITGYYWRINQQSESHTNQGINNMPEKIAKLDNYVYAYLRNKIPEEVMNEFENVYTSQHYLELCDNYICCASTDKRRLKYQLISYLHDTNYEKVIKCRKYIKDNVIRKRILYFLLSTGNIGIAIKLNVVLKRIENFSSNSNFLNKIERYFKLKK